MRSEDARDLQDFLDWLAARGRSPKTYVTYREAVIALATFTSAKGMPLLADLRREHVEDFGNHSHPWNAGREYVVSGRVRGQREVRRDRPSWTIRTSSLRLGTRYCPWR